MVEILKEALIDSAIEGGLRTVSGNGKNLLENTADVFFEKGDRAIDATFDPLIRIGGVIDDIFGW